MDDWKLIEEALNAWQAKHGEDVPVPDARDVIAAFDRLRSRDAKLVGALEHLASPNRAARPTARMVLTADSFQDTRLP